MHACIGTDTWILFFPLRALHVFVASVIVYTLLPFPPRLSMYSRILGLHSKLFVDLLRGPRPDYGSVSSLLSCATMLKLGRRRSVLLLTHDIKVQTGLRRDHKRQNHSARIATKHNISLKVVRDLQSTTHSHYRSAHFGGHRPSSRDIPTARSPTCHQRFLVQKEPPIYDPCHRPSIDEIHAMEVQGLDGAVGQQIKDLAPTLSRAPQSFDPAT